MSYQSKKWSVIEALFRRSVMFCMSVTLQRIAFPYFGVTNLELHDNVMIAAVFFSIGIVTDYAIRRGFNKMRGELI